jgi:CRP-like cAMP-binding protein
MSNITKPPLQRILQSPDFPEGQAWNSRVFQPHETLVDAGAEANALYLIETGKARVMTRVYLEDGRTMRPGICDLNPGDIFGELGLFEEQYRCASVMGITEGRLVEIDNKRLAAYLDMHPEIGYQFLKELFQAQARRLTLANQRADNLFAWGLKAHGISDQL